MRILNFGSDYAHERKLQKEKENKNHVENSNVARTIVPEELAEEMAGVGDNRPEEETQKEETQEKNETKRGRKPKGQV